VPGSVDGAELAFRAVLGQQVSVAAASRLAGQLVSRCGEPLPESLVEPDGGLTHLFPEPVAVAEIGAAALAIPAARREALRSLALALAGGEVVLDPGSDARTPTGNCFRCGGWVRGPRPTSPCGRSATPTPSRPRT
jgi:AraC family transcriptional regulator of adaptative response / DNA-3-methyladenine glycosylase II